MWSILFNLKLLYLNLRGKSKLWLKTDFYAERNLVRNTRVDGHREKTVHAIEMTCSWMDNREKKEQEKSTKCAPLRKKL